MKRSRKPYTLSNLMNALRDVKKGKYNVTTAAKIHNVPRQTLSDKVKGRSVQTLCKPGPVPLLGIEIESKLRDWVIYNSEVGFPTTREAILYSVHKVIEMHEEQKLPSFLKNRPIGDGWYKAFKRRHSDLVFKKTDLLEQNITKNEIRSWFRKIRKYLVKDAEILVDPDRIFCVGDVSLSLNLRGKKIASFADKNKVIVVFGVNAESKFVPPMVQLKYQAPESSKFDANNKSGGAKGKMACETFYDYFVKIFYPYLIECNVPFPVVVFVDVKLNCTSFPLYEFCQQNSIHLLCLLPTIINLLHPLEMGFFKIFKEAWVSHLTKSCNSDMNDVDVGALIFKIVRSLDVGDLIKQGFRKCGLFPFDCDAVDILNSNKMSQALNTLSAVASETLSRSDKFTVFISSDNKMQCQISDESSSFINMNFPENYIIEDYVVEENEMNEKDEVEIDAIYFCNDHSKSKVNSSQLSEVVSNKEFKNLLLPANMTENNDLNLNLDIQKAVADQNDNLDVLKKKNQDLQIFLKKVIDLLKEKSNVCLNLEKQNSALNSQVSSLKDVVSLTKNLLTIRNEEVDNMQKDLSSLQDKINEEKEKHSKMFDTANKVNDDIKGIYETNVKIFQQLKEKYGEKESLLIQENNRLKDELQSLRVELENVKNGIQG